MNLTELKAVKCHCRFCGRYSLTEVRECAAVNCPLHAVRFGRRPKKSVEDAYSDTTMQQRIVCKCDDCSVYEFDNRKNCKITDCYLWPYRLGRHLTESELSAYTGEGCPCCKSEARVKKAKENNNLSIKKECA